MNSRLSMARSSRIQALCTIRERWIRINSNGSGCSAPKRRFGRHDSGHFQWYSGKTAVPVSGFLGGNVLKQFRLTIDYPNRMTYWLRETEPDAHDLHSIGLTLRRQGNEFYVAGIAILDGRPTVSGVEPGDKLVQIDGTVTKEVSLGTIFTALHGKPGEVRVLTLERNGMEVNVQA